MCGTHVLERFMCEHLQFLLGRVTFFTKIGMYQHISRLGALMRDEYCRTGDLSGDPRFEWAMRYVQGLRQTRVDLPIEVLDRVSDDLVDALTDRPDLGGTKSAVYGLGRRILGFRIADALRRERNADGTYRDHPSAACSLDADALEVNGEGGHRYEYVRDLAATDPERVVLDREELGEILSGARERGQETLDLVLDTMRGLSAQEIAETHGVSLDVVYQRKSRFVRFYGE